MSSPSRNTADSSEDEPNLDDTANEAGNKSIMGKMKSRVSSILPNRFSSWFSPSTRSNNDSQNGSMNLSNNSVVGTTTKRRRRRIEMEAEDEDEDDLEDNANDRTVDASNVNNDDDDENSSSSEEERETTEATLRQLAGPPTVKPRRSINSTATGSQPPIAKRPRSDLNQTNMRDSPLISRLPLVASTPANGSSQMRTGLAATSAQLARSNINRKQLNLSQHYKPDQPYNFLEAHLQNPIKTNFTQTTASSSSATTNIINLINSQGINSKPIAGTIDVTESDNEYVSARRNLNISTSLMPNTGLQRRAPLSSVFNDEPSTSRASVGTARVSIQRTSTAINDIVSSHQHQDSADIRERCREESEESGSGAALEEADRHLNNNNIKTKYNGRAQMQITYPNKKQKLSNGGRNSEEVNNLESASDGSEESNESNMPRKMGLYNTNTTANSSRAGSRNSSMANGLNFYAHLEGRKSLFTGPNATGNRPQPFNNSTLSLTSLNRRQFNASIYGSTSALSDSRLLPSINTSSPFYKGRTTYGGAAAYNKYGSVTGAGASALRLTPTQMRPTSSLSTLSSSNASLVASAAGVATGANEHPHLSNTAKGILNLINDFSTPLNEVSKLASNLRTNSQALTPNARNRLNESNLEASRAMRLSQVSKPYMRSAVTLKPSNQYTDNRSNTTQLPPVRELQVPSMSQLLQMKRMQSSTERSRQIAAQQPANIQAYTLPIQADASDGAEKASQQQRHTNKIKSKVTASSRVTGSKNLDVDERPPSPVNLPNIAFPLMTSMPKIDIQLPVVKCSPQKLNATSASTATATYTTENTQTKPAMQFQFNSDAASKSCATAQPALSNATTSKPMFAFGGASSSSNNQNKFGASVGEGSVSSVSVHNFKFSAPLPVQANDGSSSAEAGGIKMNSFKFSTPTAVVVAPVAAATVKPVPAAAPKLKSGSVLDALKTSSPILTTTTATTNKTNSFGDSFKKSATEWECDTCMIRNKSDLTKCLACEMPRKSTTSAAAAVSSSSSVMKNNNNNNSLPSIASTFGSQFQKSANEWECDACMIRNKSEVSKCIACETPKKGITTAAAATTLPTIKSSFGDAFKPKSNTWECPTCLINNKSDNQECVACQTKNPAATNNATSALTTTTTAGTSAFKFGFVATTAAPVSSTATDSGFKSIVAQQKAASWECEACFTRNDATRSKCVCCEQAKPGTQTNSDSAPSFAFGASAATQFKFGFSNAAATTTTTSIEKDKTEEPTSKANSFAGFGAVSSTSSGKPTTGFSFGFGAATQTTSAAAATTTITKKADTVDSSKATATPLTGFKFGASADTAKTSNNTTIATTTAASNTSIATSNPTSTNSFSFGLASKKVENASTVTTSSSTTPSISFGLPAAAASTGTSEKNDKPLQFGFASTQKKSDDNSKTSTAEFAFKVPSTPTTTAADTPATVAVTTAKPMFSFGATPAVSTSAATITTTTSLAAASNSTFTFGSSSTIMSATKSMFGVVSSSSTTPTASNLFGQTTSAASSSTTVTSTTTTFGSFTAAASGSKNVFGGFAAPQMAATDTSKAAATPSLFGSTNAGTVMTNNAAPTTTSFGFGGATAAGSVATTTVTGTNSSMTGASWPKKPFVFGSGGGGADANATGSNSAAATDAAKPSLFGSFGGVNSNSSSFAAAAAGALKSSDSAPPAYGSNTTSTNNIFGSTSSTTSAPAAAVPNIFGTAATASGNATTPQVPAFGAAPAFGGITASNATPTFGSTAASASTVGSSTFGSGSTSSGATPTFGSFSAGTGFANGGAPANQEIKKPEPFKFGDPAKNTTGVFSFGATGSGSTAAPAAKPAFNFTATTTIQPSFNFTGSAEQSQPQTQQPKPFQFGAITSTPPTFNFSGGAVEATPNAPFQFNAGTAPANTTTNIFAPTPGTQSAQQPRRKIRAPIRRLTPR